MMHRSEAERNPSTVDELLADTRFQEWVLRGNPAPDAYWTAWMERHPGGKAMIDAAREVLLSIRFAEHRPDPSRKAAARESYLAGLAAAMERERRARVVRMFRSAAAAAAVLLVVSAGWYAWRNLRAEEYVTAYGEIRRLTLPDHTEVVLQANSRLRVAGKWRYDGDRKVQLDGEAWFKVPPIAQHGNPAPPFTVSAGNASITVLGTTFNVRHRRRALEVVLIDGKVRVDAGEKSRVLTPGEKVRFVKGQPVMSVTQADTAAVAAWTKGQLVLHRTTAEEVLHYLEDNYGYTVRQVDSSLLKKELEGEFVQGKPEDILFLLSQLLDADITVDGKNLDLKKR